MEGGMRERNRHSENNYAFIQTAPVSHALVLCFKNEKSLHMPLVFTLTQTGHSEELKSVSMLFSIFTMLSLKSHKSHNRHLLSTIRSMCRREGREADLLIPHF